LTEVGPHDVEMVSLPLVDPTRPTPANPGSDSSDERSLPTTVWLPGPEADPGPLVIFAHGFGSTAADGAALAERWASFGYVVAAPDFPTTHTGAPGGLLAADVVEQPADVTFLVNTLGEASRDPESPLYTRVDASRAAIAGLSLGALTALLLLEEDEAPIDSAVLMATPSCFLAPGSIPNTTVPTLAVHGDADVVTPFDTHALPLQDPRNDARWLVRIAGGTHTGFSTLAQPAVAGLDHADMLGCDFLTPHPDLWDELATAVDGDAASCSPICASAPPWPDAVDAGLQLQATAALSLIHFGRTLRACDDAQALWEQLLDGEAVGLEVL
ncbi:MAG: hypothetical protein AAF799_45145, partial [Myxococcota bacterium]